MKRPENATIDALRTFLNWMDQCKEIGWQESDMAALEALWWKHHDEKGEWKRKSK